MNLLVSSFDLTLFSPPSFITYGDEECVSEELHLRPAVIGIGSVLDEAGWPVKADVPDFNLDRDGASLAQVSTQLNPPQDQSDLSVLYAEDHKLTKAELESFAILGRGLRLPREEGVVTSFSKYSSSVRVGQRRLWQEGWKPSLVVVNKVVLTQSEWPDLPRWG